MKRYLIMPVLMVLMAVSGYAAGSLQRNVGYTVTDQIDIMGAYFGEAGTYKIGALLDQQFLTPYKGCRIMGMRVAAGTNLGRTRMFLYDTSSGQPVVVHEQKQRLTEGWNDISFSGNGYTITGDEAYFFGFDYVETEDMATAQKGGVASVGEDTSGAFMLLADDNNLYEVTGAGILCVQLVVDISSLPATKMSYTFFDPGFRYKKADEQFVLTTMMHNDGRDDITSFRMGYAFDNMEASYQDVDKSVLSGATVDWTLALNMPEGYAVGAHTFNVWVDQINGAEPSSTEASARTVNFAVYENEMQRKCMYVEVYADQNAPLSAKFDNALASAATTLGDGAEYVKVFAPGNKLAIADTEYLHQLYAYTVPTFTINRSYFPCEAHVAYDMNDYLLSFPVDFQAGILSEIIAYDNSSRCFAEMDLSGQYDEATRGLTIDVRGKINDETLAIYERLGLTVMLVEDGVIATQVKLNEFNRQVRDEAYVHNNVLRAFMTSPRGNDVTVQGDEFQDRLTFTLDPSWNISKMRAVAIVGKHPEAMNADNLKDYDVTNAATLSLNTIAAVTTVTADGDEDLNITYYGLDGVEVQQPLAPGLYIKHMSNGTTAKVLVQ